MKRKFVAIAKAAICIISTINFTALAASTFADINDVPWVGSAQYINEAASLGLMSGYTENGMRICKAKNNVTYCETVQLMYSIMSSYSGTSTSSTAISNWTSTMVFYKIPTWAYNSVAYALENSILSANDLSIFIASNGSQNNARREDVAVIFGKALSKVYSLTPNPSISYNDKSSISSTSIPYIELLNELDIMVGDSNNNFNPKVNINRAEMAVISTKAYNKLKNKTTTAPSKMEQASNTSYSGYKECPYVPDFGIMFDADSKLDKSIKGNIVSITYTYSDVDISSSKGIAQYSNAIKANGFIYNGKTGSGDLAVYSYINSNKSILVKFSISEIGNKTLSIVNVQYDSNIINSTSTNYTYYSEFQSVPDFGKLTGATQYEKISLGNGDYEYGYDLFSFDLSSSLKMYDKALKNNGFNLVYSDKDSIIYANGNGDLCVGIGVDDAKSLFYIDVYYVNIASTNYTYYSEFPSVPDFGNIANIPLVSKVTDGNGYLYSYNVGFNDSYIDEYDKILDENGFSLYSKIDNGLLYKKGNLFVSMSLDNRYSTFDIAVMYLYL